MGCNEWIEEVAAARTFAEVGGLWGTVNEKVTVAAKANAISTTMIDIQPENHNLWKAFYDRCKEKDVTCNQSIVANLDDPAFPDTVGRYDVVHCSGIIYHCPNPLYTVSQLAKITKKYLILASTVIPLSISNQEGTISMEDGSALSVAALTEKQKRVINEYFREVGASELFPPGSTCSVVDNDAHSVYTPWWYLFTPKFVSGLLAACGAVTVDTSFEWQGRTAYFLAKFR